MASSCHISDKCFPKDMRPKSECVMNKTPEVRQIQQHLQQHQATIAYSAGQYTRPVSESKIATETAVTLESLSAMESRGTAFRWIMHQLMLHQSIN